ncbi:osmotically inducible protein C [Mangrovimonas yunxiaonensis]|uniref:Osmotically inducible protein C n=1 Tax=Mangrovimonas yunxiaonensis TaxID=1197477 RepID=A0A084TM58_9FLAO|nr:OsmC family protein [Mangrovimonas yunxiaonensis]KFB01794.1 osmotically inducible protein C [Mangrovimonas yunxiaonensis]GGH41013.1 osmotically inducible protein C [Mangrovimonas yunxiaonensis]
MSDLIFKVHGESASPAKFIAKTRNFKLIIDEPEDLGGTDEHANPVEYLLAGLAGCVNVVGHLVAKELGFTINSLKIEVEGNINPDKLFGTSNKERAGFKEISLKLIPETEASIETLVTWLKIVQERCPVKDNLLNATPVSLEVEKQYAI